MAYLTNSDYYASESNHGSYQYISLKDIIRNYMLMYVGDDQIDDNVPIHKVRFIAKQAIKELNYDAFKSTRVVEEEIQSSLKYIMPSDYVDFLRISKLTNGVMYPMVENRNAFSADSYLRDSSNEILFDSNGEILLSSSSELEQSRVNGIQSYAISARYGLDPTMSSGNPTFKINSRAGVIDFDSRMSGETMILEYISDGMEGGDDNLIVVNKFFEKYLYANISYELLDGKAGIADNVKTRARQKQRALYRNARIRIGSNNPHDLMMTLRGANNWNKG